MEIEALEPAVAVALIKFLLAMLGVAFLSVLLGFLLQYRMNCGSGRPRRKEDKKKTLTKEEMAEVEKRW